MTPMVSEIVGSTSQMVSASVKALARILFEFISIHRARLEVPRRRSDGHRHQLGLGDRRQHLADGVGNALCTHISTTASNIITPMATPSKNAGVPSLGLRQTPIRPPIGDSEDPVLSSSSPSTELA